MNEVFWPAGEKNHQRPALRTRVAERLPTKVVVVITTGMEWLLRRSKPLVAELSTTATLYFPDFRLLTGLPW